VKRRLERPNLVHVITTCFGLMYLLLFVSSWLSFLTNPFFEHSFSFVITFAAFGLILLAAGTFLVSELVRQRRLFRKWKSL
jgi:uncharacterized membrane protein YbhN (UPF0104 family)